MIKGFISHFMRIRKINSILFGDPARINQIFSNLLSNAIKYTDYGNISVFTKLIKLDRNIAEVAIIVKDTGRGISESDIGKIFTPYFQVEDLSKQVLESSGLGLPIVKMAC